MSSFHDPRNEPRLPVPRENDDEDNGILGFLSAVGFIVGVIVIFVLVMLFLYAITRVRQ